MLIRWLKAWGSTTAKTFRWLSRIVLVVAIAWVGSALLMRWIATPGQTEIDLQPNADHTLVVVVHGLSGRSAIQPTVDLAAKTFPEADVLTISYDARLFSNADVYEIANQLESAIHDAQRMANYGSIVLVGHSMGATQPPVDGFH